MACVIIMVYVYCWCSEMVQMSKYYVLYELWES